MNSKVKGSVEVVRKSELVVVHGVLVNYDQPVAEAISGLPYNSSLVYSIPQAIWNGGKKGRVETDVHLARAGKYLPTQGARRFVRDQRLNPCVPAELAGLKPFCQELWGAGVYWAVALDSSDETLWRDPNDHLLVVYLRFGPGYRGFYLGFAAYGWSGHDSFAGLPQVS